MKETELQSISNKLNDFINEFNGTLAMECRCRHCAEYLSGLMLDGERKSIDPIAARIEGADNQALQQFINQSPDWKNEIYPRAAPALGSLCPTCRPPAAKSRRFVVQC